MHLSPGANICVLPTSPQRSQGSTQELHVRAIGDTDLFFCFFPSLDSGPTRRVCCPKWGRMGMHILLQNTQKKKRKRLALVMSTQKSRGARSLRLTRKALSGEGDFWHCQRRKKVPSRFLPGVRIKNADGIKPMEEREICEQGAGLIIPAREAASSLLKDLSVWKWKWRVE